MLCYAMLCYAMLCYAMLCYAMLCAGGHHGVQVVRQGAHPSAPLHALCSAMLCYAMLCYAFCSPPRRPPHLQNLVSVLLSTSLIWQLSFVTPEGDGDVPFWKLPNPSTAAAAAAAPCLLLLAELLPPMAGPRHACAARLAAELRRRLSAPTRHRVTNELLRR
jgi:hypothetical protein